FEKKTSIYKNKESLIVKQVTGRKVNWVLNDYVDSCDEDVKLNLIKNSIEIKNFFFGKGYTVLFAYKIGCVGGIDTVPVKYFAYNNGIKYSLRGEEHIIIGNDSYGGEREPIPDTNLKKNKKLLSYMRGKWKSVALTKY
ncbi:TPA: M949_RS01915 family surface polysaccharide biosynthesis protein, partial [Pluralibacter gergoviae]